MTLPPKTSGRVALKSDAKKLSALLKRTREDASDDTSTAKVVALAFGYSESELARDVTGIAETGDLITRNGRVAVPDELREIVSRWAMLRGWSA